MNTNTSEFHGFADLTAAVRRNRAQIIDPASATQDIRPPVLLSPDEIDALFQQIAREPDRVSASLIALALLTGHDPAVLLDWLWVTGPLEVVVVGDETTGVPINTPVAALLKSLWRVGSENCRVFGDLDRPDVLSYLDAVLLRISGHADLPELKFRDLQANSRYVGLFESIFGV